MTNIRMKAFDTLHVSSVKADNILPGEEFDVPQYIADDLEKRGLAEKVAEQKQEPAPPQNKAEPAPLNKTTAPAAKSK